MAAEGGQGAVGVVKKQYTQAKRTDEQMEDNDERRKRDEEADSRCRI